MQEKKPHTITLTNTETYREIWSIINHCGLLTDSHQIKSFTGIIQSLALLFHVADCFLYVQEQRNIDQIANSNWWEQGGFLYLCLHLLALAARTVGTCSSACELTWCFVASKRHLYRCNVVVVNEAGTSLQVLHHTVCTFHISAMQQATKP